MAGPKSRDSENAGRPGGVTLADQEKVLALLKGLNGLDPLKQLLWTELNYKRVNTQLSRRALTEAAAKTLAEDPVLFAAGGEEDAFHVIYARLAADRLKLGHERQVVSKLLQDHPYALFIFSNDTRTHWHFLNVKYDKNESKRRLYRRITVGPEERLRTASDRISMLDLATISPDLFGVGPIPIQNRHDEAFDVEQVTRRFYDEYKAVYEILQDDLRKQTKDTTWAHDYALQFLNRCMFIYFVQRKRWLGNDTDFLSSYWRAYQKTGGGKNEFFEKWLKVLFFEAFNNRKTLLNTRERSYLPEEMRNTLWQAPYLNGGLFEENKLDHKPGFTVGDSRFLQVFTFLERYNFTIAEDSPLDQEVAVDPEMIGKVYESLVNVSTEADERGDAGIFYTPRTEIDLMCRLSLVDNMTNHLGAKHKNLLYEVIFALEPDEREQADASMTKAGLWPDFYRRLQEITVVDPACGSGSFLVGMLHILDNLTRRAQRQLNEAEKNFDRKKRIIGQSLYGVDVMPWACHVAELRLWLALIIDAEFSREELHIRKDPLLPHFSFKVRCGDSLVQEVGGINLGHMREGSELNPVIKGKITRLRNEKYKFYNHEGGKFRNPEDAETEELDLFREILETREGNLREELKKLKRRLDQPSAPQIRLDGSEETKPHQLKLESASVEKQIEAVQMEMDRVSQARAALKSPKNVPFVWDIAFVEVFGGDEKGFDIVIGNPPYVRQEFVSDPKLPRESVTTENKKLYKGKLQRSVYQAFPRFFGYKVGEDRAVKKLDAKSDLYIYFYFHGLSLLNSKGTFCFITSNSWLDVGYGSDLQEFLLQRCRVKMILDNQVKRSFVSADVNTVIALFSAPSPADDDPQQRMEATVARFVMFTVPFEHALSAVLFEELEEARERKFTPDYRVVPLSQDKLFVAGLESPGDDEDKSSKQIMYAGNKWGGKYLRAPEIYWTILEKGKGRLVRLSDVAEVKRGITTGVNEFFYLDAASIAEWQIEDDFAQPVIKSPRECKRILLEPKDLKFHVFMCHKDKKELKGTAALEYIKWGEKQGFDERPSCSGRARWWDLGERRTPPVIAPCGVSELMRTFKNAGVLVDKRLYEVYPKKVDATLLFMNSVIFSMFCELGSRTGLGEGLLDLTVYELADCPVLILEDAAMVKQTLKRCLYHEQLPLHEELKHTDRQALDSVFFDALRLTRGERSAVYEAIITLVEARSKKAESLDPKKLKKRAEAAEKLRGIWMDQPDNEAGE